MVRNILQNLFSSLVRSSVDMATSYSYKTAVSVVDLILAIQENDEDAVRDLAYSSIVNKCDPRPNGRRSTPLHFAVGFGFYNIVMLLLERGADINKRDKNFLTALHNASCWGYIDITQELLSHGADIDAVDDSHSTPLHKAALFNQPAIVRLLLKHGARGFVNQNGKYPIDLCKPYQFELLQAFKGDSLDMSKDDKERWFAFKDAIEKGLHPSKLHNLFYKDLCDMQEPRIGCRYTWLHYACSFNHLDQVKFLIDESVNLQSVDGEGCVPLINSASVGFEQIVKILLENGAIANAIDRLGNTSLMIATAAGHDAIVRLLLLNGAERHLKNSSNKSAFDIARDSESSVALTLLMNPNMTSKGSNKQLFLAVRDGNLEDVQAYVTSDNINISDVWISDRRASLLHLATGFNNLSIVKFLLQSNADHDTRDIDGFTPIHNAAFLGHFDIVKLLIKHGADINATDNIDRTPLHLATSKCHTRVVSLLLRSGAKIDVFTVDGKAPIDLVPEKNYNIRCVFSDFNKSHSPLSKLKIFQWQQVKKSITSLDAVNELRPLLSTEIIEAVDPDPLSRKSFLLHFAAGYGCSDVCQLLIDRGADVHSVDIDGLIPLHNACMWGHVSVAHLLLRNGSTLDFSDDWGNTPLHKASSMGRIGCVKLLLKHGANPCTVNRNNVTPLNVATSEDLRYTLLFSEFSVPNKDLFIAIRNGDIKKVGHLLTELNVNSTDDHGVIDNFRSTPLHVASKFNRIDIAELLLEAGADGNMRDTSGLVPLHNAVVFGHEEMVKLLLLHGSYINSLDNRKWTPLHEACHKNYDMIVKFLLDAGARVDLFNKLGQLPRDLAPNENSKTINYIDAYKKEKFESDEASMKPSANAVLELFDIVKSGALHQLKKIWQPGFEVLTDPAPSGLRSYLLHMAAGYGNTEVVNFLLDNGANVDCKNVGGLTPLHHACSWGNVDSARALLDAGASINSLDNMKSSPLHLASRNGRSHCVELLLQHDADSNAENSKGIIPYKLCKNIETKRVFEKIENEVALFSPSAANFSPGNTLKEVPRSERQVSIWLRELGLKNVNDIINQFVENDIDMEGIKFLTDEQLQDIGISAVGSRNRIINAIKERERQDNECEGSQTVVGDANVHEVFICYSQVDKDLMKRIHRVVEKEGFRSWIGKRQNELPSLFRKKASQAIYFAKIILFITTSTSVEDTACIEEVTFAYDNGKQIFPLIFDINFKDKINAGLEMLIKRFQWTIFDGKVRYMAVFMRENSEYLDFSFQYQSFDEMANRLLIGMIKYRTSSQEDLDLESSISSDKLALLMPIEGAEATDVKIKNRGLADTLTPKEVFISWAHKDSTFVAEKLWPDLEHKNIDCWIDFNQLIAGNLWRTQIGEAIKGCKVLLFVVSPASVLSRYTNEEIQFAYDSKKVIIVVHYESSAKELDADAGLSMLLRSCPNVDFTVPSIYSSMLQKLVNMLKDHSSVKPPIHHSLKKVPPQNSTVAEDNEDVSRVDFRNKSRGSQRMPQVVLPPINNTLSAGDSQSEKITPSHCDVQANLENVEENDVYAKYMHSHNELLKAQREATEEIICMRRDIAELKRMSEKQAKHLSKVCILS